MKVEYDYTGNELYGLTLHAETELDKEILRCMSNKCTVSNTLNDVSVSGDMSVNIKLTGHINVETELKLKD